MSTPMKKMNQGNQGNENMSLEKEKKKDETQRKRSKEMPALPKRSKIEPKKNPTQSKKEDKTLPKDGYLIEIDENLFNLPGDVPLAHCVAEDLRMGAGIATEFKRYFGGVGQLIDQNLTVGNVGVVVNDRNVTAFYLITKKYSNGKPTMQTLTVALKSLLEKMKQMNLTKLGIPRIGCGLDGLDWVAVKALIANVFDGSRIRITVCSPSKVVFNRIPPPQLKVFITPRTMLEVEAKSDILLFVDLAQFKANNWTNDLVDRVNNRYPSFKEKLVKDITTKVLCPGDVSTYIIENERINCLFTSPTAYYSSLEKGFINIKNGIRNYRNFVFHSGPIKPADNFKHISRMVLILRSIVHSSELWLCGDTDQTKHKEVYDNYCRNVINETRFAPRPTAHSNRPIGGRPNQHNTQFNNQKWKNAQPKYYFQRQ